MDDHAQFREGIKRILALDPMFEVVGEAADAREGANLADSLKPDLMLVDVRLPDRSGIQLTRHIVGKHPKIRVVILSMFASEDYAMEAFQAGAVGYLVKHSGVSDLFDALRNVMAGDWVLDRTLNVFSHFPKTGRRPGPESTSTYETPGGKHLVLKRSHRKNVERRSVMNAFNEKRNQDRWPFEVSIVYSKFHSGIDHASQSFNFSDTGLCVKMSSPIPKGTPVFVRVESMKIAKEHKNQDLIPKTVGLAEVRWCRKVDTGSEPFYQVGMKYLHPSY